MTAALDALPPSLRRWIGHMALPIAAVIGVQFFLGGLGPLGLGDGTIPLEVLGVGWVVGALYGLVGVGIVLVWRSHRLLNLAQAQLGAVPAVGALVLVGERGWPYLPAVALAFVCAAGLGIASERVVIRRFDNAPRLAATIATLGLAQVLVGFEILLPRWLAGIEGVAGVPETPFGSWSTTIGVVTFRGDHVAALVAGLVLSALVAVGLRRSKLGLAVRAMAARPIQAAQLGVPVGGIRAGVWAVAAVASTLAVLLRVPLVGFPLGGLVGPGVLLYGLTAAAFARFDDPVRAVAGGLAVGTVEQGAVYATGRSTAADAAMFVLIVIALLAQRRSRGRLADVGAWLPAREVPPLPWRVWSAPRVRAVRLGATVVIATAMFVLPPLLSAGQPTRLTTLAAFGVLAISAVMLTGWSGQLGLGQVAVAGVGAVVAGGLVTGGGRSADLFVVIALSALAGAVVSIGVGLPVVRSTGPQLAITTLAFAFAVPAIITNPGVFEPLFPDGPIERPVLFGRVDLSPEHRFTYLALALLVVALVVVRRVRSSRAGRLMLAGRDDIRAVQAVGMAPVRVRLFVFGVSGALAGAAGAIIAWNQGVVEASTFAPQRSLDLVGAVVIGGISSPLGALAGVVWVFGLPILFPGSPFVAAIGSGVGVLVVLMVQPGGLAVLAGGWWRRAAIRLSGDDVEGEARGGSIARIAGVPEALETAGRSPLPDLVVRRLDVESVTEVGPAGDPTIVAAGGVEGTDGMSAVDTGAEETNAVGATPMLRVEGLVLHRGGNLVLDSVSLDVVPGECVALVGTNGAGKSSLLDVIAGGLRPAAGSVQIGGVDVTGARPIDVTALGVAVHPGARACFPDLTVDEHLVLADHYRRSATGVSIDEVYDVYQRLSTRRDVAAGALSGGERHLLGFALATMSAPALLLVDELSLGLAPNMVEDLVAAVAGFRDRGCTVVVVDQGVDHLHDVVDRAVFLERGTVRFDGTVDDLVASDAFLRPVLTAEPAGPLPGPERECPTERHGDSLTLRDVSVSYGGVDALRGVSLTVQAGTVLGLVGGNGAGKTTLLDAVSGHALCTGTVEIGGEDVTSLSASARAGAGLGRSFQAGSGLDALTVRECLTLAQDRGMRPRSLLAIGVPVSTASEVDASLRAELLAADAGLLEWIDTPSGDLSTGLRRRAELSMAAAHAPKVLLLDEPTSGVAVSEIPSVVAVVRRLADRGAAVIVVDHDLAFIGEVADSVVELVDGRIVGDTEVDTADPTSGSSADQSTPLSISVGPPPPMAEASAGTSWSRTKGRLSGLVK